MNQPAPLTKPIRPSPGGVTIDADQLPQVTVTPFVSFAGAAVQ
jgi:hypothetical protein